MHWRTVKKLDELAQIHIMVNASAIPSVVTLYAQAVLLYLFLLSGFKPILI